MHCAVYSVSLDAAAGTAGGGYEMTLQKAIKLLEAEYEKAKNLSFVRNKLAYALYQVWRIADREDMP